MAATTVTSTLVNNGPVKANLVGVNYARCVHKSATTTSTLSSSVCLQMIPLPHGARVIDLWVNPGDAWAAGGYSVGDGSDTDRFVTTTSLTVSAVLTRLNAPTGFGYLVSLTASDVNSFDTIDITFSGAITSTLTGTIEMVAFYVMDANAGS